MDKLLSMLGLAYKAGKIKFGGKGVTDAVRGKNKPDLVLLAQDASENSVKKVSDCCTYYQVRLLTAYATKAQIGHMLKGRSDVACVAVTDSGFANAIFDLINKKPTDSSASAGGAHNDI